MVLQAFAMDVLRVTNGQWKSMMAGEAEAGDISRSVDVHNQLFVVNRYIVVFVFNRCS